MRTAKTTPDGRVIADRTPNAKVAHPHPRHKGELVPTQGVNEIMLEDGTVLTECDACGKAFENPRSAVAHMPSHNPDRLGTRYPDATLRAIAREIARAGGPKTKGVFPAVAATLNAKGVKTVKGAEWTSGSLNHVYNLYCKEIRVRIPVRREAMEPAILADRLATAVQNGASGQELGVMAQAIQGAAEGLGALGAQLLQGAEELAAVAKQLLELADREVDPEVVAKARKWDALREAMGPS